MTKTISIWPNITEDRNLFFGLAGHIDGVRKTLSASDHPLGVHVMLYKPVGAPVIASNTITWQRLNPVAEQGALPDNTLLVECLNTVDVFELAGAALPGRTVNAQPLEGWISCLITSDGVLVGAREVIKQSHDPDWEKAFAEEANCTAEDKAEMARIGNPARMSALTASFILPEDHGHSAHYLIKRLPRLRTALSWHLDHLNKHMPTHTVFQLDPSWLPPQPA